MILSLRDGVFSTIQPAGLASIARRLNLSWQECAKYVGVSAPELHAQGNIDAIVDYSPSDSPEKIENLRSAIVGSLINIESQTAEFVAENPYILDHYRQSLLRYLKDQTANKPKVASPMDFSGSKNPTEYLNVFGIAFRYLRYLRVRKRIKATSTKQYGRLAPQEMPSGELHIRADRERRQTFLYWLQDPDKVVYDDGLAKAWRNYLDKRQAINDERGRIAKMIFGEPKQNFENARNSVISSFGAFSVQPLEARSGGKFSRPAGLFAQDVTDTRQILQVKSVASPRELLAAIRRNEDLMVALRQRFSYQGRKLFSEDSASESYVAKQLMAELNMIITGPRLDGAEGATDIQANRAYLSAALPEFISASSRSHHACRNCRYECVGCAASRGPAARFCARVRKLAAV